MDGQSSSLLPVFVNPTDLKFIVSSPETHKRVLTVYNPYDFSLRFTVLSNAPSKYRVVEPRGFIRPRYYVDIIVRHLSPTIAAIGTNDCLRIEIFREGDSQPCGRKDIAMSVLKSDSIRNPEHEQFRAFPGSALRAPTTSGAYAMRSVSFATGAQANSPINQQNSTMLTGFLISCILVCLVVLALPAHKEPCVCECSGGGRGTASSADHNLVSPDSSSTSSFSFDTIIPVQLQPSENGKKVAACVIGVATFALFQQNR